MPIMNFSCECFAIRKDTIGENAFMNFLFVKATDVKATEEENAIGEVQHLLSQRRRFFISHVKLNTYCCM